MRSDGRMHEKGVDVALAVEILLCAYEEPNIAKIFLVSSDTDLLPAIAKARERGKIVEYVGFSHKPSLGPIANCSTSHLLSNTDIVPFVSRPSAENTQPKEIRAA